MGAMILQAMVLALGVAAAVLALTLLREARGGPDRLFAGGLITLALVFGWLVLADPLADSEESPIAAARAKGVSWPASPDPLD